MSMPITSLELVHGVGLLYVPIHLKAPTSYYFLFMVALMSDMVSALLGFLLQPFNRHPLIASGSVSLELVLTLPAYKLSRWYLLHYAPKVNGVGIVSNDLLAGLRLLLFCGSDGRHISLMVPMKHDTWSSNDVVLVQLVQFRVLLVR